MAGANSIRSMNTSSIHCWAYPRWDNHVPTLKSKIYIDGDLVVYVPYAYLSASIDSLELE